MTTDALVSIGVDLSAMRREISKLPNMVDSEAQRALVKYEKTVAKAAAAAKQANRRIAAANRRGSAATSEQTKRLGEFQDAAGDADSTIVGLSGALDMVSPAMADAAGFAGDLGAGLESVTRLIKGGHPAMLALAAATTALAAGYSLWRAEQEKHAKVVEASTAALKSHHGLLRDLDAANQDLRVTLGLLSEEDAELSKARTAHHAKLKPLLAEQTAMITEQSIAVGEAERKWVELRDIVDEAAEMTEQQRAAQRVSLGEMTKRRNEALDVLVKERLELDRRDAAQKKLIATSDQELLAITTNIEKKHEQAAAEKAAAEAAREAADALTAQADALSRVNAQLELNNIIAGATFTAITALEDPFLQLEAAEQRINDEHEAAIRNLDSLATSTAGLAGIEDARTALALKREQELRQAREQAVEASEAQVAADQKAAEKLAELAEAETQAARDAHQAHLDRIEERRAADKAAADERLAQQQAEAEAVMSAAGQITGSMSSLAETRSEENERLAQEAMDRADALRENGQQAAAEAAEAEAEVFKKAALEQFHRSQALAAAQVQLELAVGLLRAITENVDRPAVAVAMSAAVIAAGATQLAAIQSTPPPAFDIGGMVAAGGIRSQSGDSVPALLRPGEGVLTSKGVDAIGGASGVHSANRGEVHPPQVVALPVFRHFDRAVSVELRRPGALKRAISTAGQRSNRTGQRGY